MRTKPKHQAMREAEAPGDPEKPLLGAGGVRGPGGDGSHWRPTSPSQPRQWLFQVMKHVNWISSNGGLKNREFYFLLSA